MEYKRGSGVLEIGDMVFVHPTKSSEASKKYVALIVKEGEDIGTIIPGGHFSIMREYLFNRLEKI